MQWRQSARRFEQQGCGERGDRRKQRRDPWREPALRTHGSATGRDAHQQYRDGREEQRHLPRQPQPPIRTEGRQLDAAREFAQDERSHSRREQHAHQRLSPRTRPHPVAQCGKQGEEQQPARDRQRARVRSESATLPHHEERRVEQRRLVGEVGEWHHREHHERDRERAEPSPDAGVTAPCGGEEQQRRHREDKHAAPAGHVRRLGPQLIGPARDGSCGEQGLAAELQHDGVLDERRRPCSSIEETGDSAAACDASIECSREIRRRTVRVQQHRGHRRSRSLGVDRVRDDIEVRRHHPHRARQRIHGRQQFARPGEQAPLIDQEHGPVIGTGLERSEVRERVVAFIGRAHGLAGHAAQVGGHRRHLGSQCLPCLLRSGRFQRRLITGELSFGQQMRERCDREGDDPGRDHPTPAPGDSRMPDRPPAKERGEGQ